MVFRIRREYIDSIQGGTLFVKYKIWVEYLLNESFMKILFLEPFYGGSHRDFADGLAEHSGHSITLVTLPARFWKWRMRGSGLWFAHSVEHPESFDLLLASDMVALADVKALWGTKTPPIILYFHENQLSYPLPEGEKMDYQFGFTTITSAMVADRCVFNSRFHLSSFFSDLPGFLKKMPEYKPLWIPDILREKSVVLYPGCRFSPVGTPPKDSGDQTPTILWNHRWEYDKDPDTFFDALDTVDRMGLQFNLMLLGENFQGVPKRFIQAKERYGGRILKYGYLDSRGEYYKALESSDIIISTANQENFGISVIEAVRHGCFPLLPSRLSYPEILPKRFHNLCLYHDSGDLVQKLADLLKNRKYPRLSELSKAMAQYSWSHIAREYDDLFSGVIAGDA